MYPGNLFLLANIVATMTFSHMPYLLALGIILQDAGSFQDHWLPVCGEWSHHNYVCLGGVFSPHLLLFFFIMWQQICHRDLKLENTLLDGSPAPRLKICDFGYSKVFYSVAVPLLCWKTCILCPSWVLANIMKWVFLLLSSRKCDRNSGHRFLHNCLPWILSRLLCTNLHLLLSCLMTSVWSNGS